MDIKQGLGTFVFRKQESVSIRSSTFEQLFHFGRASNAPQTFDFFSVCCACLCRTAGAAAVAVLRSGMPLSSVLVRFHCCYKERENFPDWRREQQKVTRHCNSPQKTSPSIGRRRRRRHSRRHRRHHVVDFASLLARPAQTEKWKSRAARQMSGSP